MCPKLFTWQLLSDQKSFTIYKVLNTSFKDRMSECFLMIHVCVSLICLCLQEAFFSKINIWTALVLTHTQFCKSVFIIFNKVLKPIVIVSKYLIRNNFHLFQREQISKEKRLLEERKHLVNKRCQFVDRSYVENS